LTCAPCRVGSYDLWEPQRATHPWRLLAQGVQPCCWLKPFRLLQPHQRRHPHRHAKEESRIQRRDWYCVVGMLSIPLTVSASKKLPLECHSTSICGTAPHRMTVLLLRYAWPSTTKLLLRAVHAGNRRLPSWWSTTWLHVHARPRSSTCPLVHPERAGQTQNRESCSRVPPYNSYHLFGTVEHLSVTYMQAHLLGS
jgi:hypothetical protein